jgi:glycosyltransferase involved in cell wall biosynthesis
VLIEALACGTPVVAYRRGSIPEIIDDGATGFVCDGLDDMTAAMQHIPDIDRRQCRQSFEERFTVGRMAQDYLHVYERALQRQPGLLAEVTLAERTHNVLQTGCLLAKT